MGASVLRRVRNIWCFGLPVASFIFLILYLALLYSLTSPLRGGLQVVQSGQWFPILSGWGLSMTCHTSQHCKWVPGYR